MRTIPQIKQEQQDKVSAMLDRLNVIFAFSNQQFERNRKQGVTYVNLGIGMFVPKKNVEDVIAELQRIENQTSDALKCESSMEAFILYELCNHECFYTGEYSDVLELTQVYFPDCHIDDIHRVYMANLKENLD